MKYSVYISNHCEGCEQVLDYLKEHHIQHSVKNIDTDEASPSVNVFIVPALFLNDKLLAYGPDIVRYFEKQDT